MSKYLHKYETLVHLLLLATLAGSVDLKLRKTDETFCLFVLRRKLESWNQKANK